VAGLESAHLEPPVWIGPEANLGESARLHRCVVGPRCEVQEEAHVEDAVLMEGSQIGRGSRLRAVVVEEGAKVPPGTELCSQVLVWEKDGLVAYDLSPRV
jgi:ADP-glucose pyrophosphorylase